MDKNKKRDKIDIPIVPIVPFSGSSFGSTAGVSDINGTGILPFLWLGEDDDDLEKKLR